MGPYCKFCGTRCFVPLPLNTPEHIVKAYGSSNIVATCRGGQAFERMKVGFCYDDILSLIHMPLQPGPGPEIVTAGAVRPEILVTPEMNEHIIVVIPRDRCSDEGAHWFISLIDDGFERTGVARQGDIEVKDDCFIARYFQFAWKGSAA